MHYVHRQYPNPRQGTLSDFKPVLSFHAYSISNFGPPCLTTLHADRHLLFDLTNCIAEHNMWNCYYGPLTLSQRLSGTPVGPEVLPMSAVVNTRRMH
jgi:hypothetical protein